VGKRRKSRELALQVLYQIDIDDGGDAEEKFNLFWQHFDHSDGLKEFSHRIVKGVCQRKEEIDSLIEKHSEHWRLQRMTIVDRNVLRSAVFELMCCPDIPTKVILNVQKRLVPSLTEFSIKYPTRLTDHKQGKKINPIT